MSVKLLEEQLDHRPGLRIGVHIDRARREEHIAHRDPMEQGPTLGFVETPPLQPLPHRLEFDFAHRPF